MNHRQSALASLSHDVLASAAATGSASAVAHQLVERLCCASAARRVSLVVTHSDVQALQLVVISGQTQPDVRREAVKAILESAGDAQSRAASLDETHTIVCVPDGSGVPDDASVSRYATKHGVSLATAVRRMPEGGYVACVFERDIQSRFAVAEVERYLASADDALALVHRLYREKLPFARRVMTTLRELRHSLSLPSPLKALGNSWQRRVPRAASVAIAASVFLLAGLVVPVPHVVKARVTIEAADRQVVSVAEGGHLRSAHAKPGDKVIEGEVLATLDERDAVLVLASWQGEANRNREERSKALATRDREALGTLRADSARIAAELERAERQLEFRTIVAPFSGVVLKGDPGARLGATVEAGEVLFEIGTLEDVRVMIDVDERDVRLVRAGQSARVRMAGLPSRRWAVELDEPLPVAVSEPGKNVFRVPANFSGESTGLRPGMQGVTRISVGHQPILIAWTRKLRESFALLAWRLGLVA